MSGQTAVGLRSERGPILVSLMVSTGLIAVDATVVATAVPSIVGEIGGFSAYPWLFTVYVLTSAVTVPVYSKLADTVGRKPIVVIGISIFLAGSVLCGVAWNMPALIAFRALQGLGAGAIMPMTITVMGDIYSLSERARVQGYVASVWGAASVIGPTLGGLFAQLHIWRGIFLVNIPLCVLAIVLLVRNYHERLERRDHRIDIAGAILLTAALALLLLGVLEGGVAWPWISPISIGVFAGGAVLLAAFVMVERHAAEPVLPLWVFTRPVVAASAGLSLALGAMMIVYPAFIPTYLEHSVGAAPLAAGLALAAVTLGWPLAAAFTGRIYLRFGFRFASILGASLALLGATVVALLAPAPNIWVIAAVLFLVGLGFGFGAVPSLVAAQSSVPWRERATATGTTMFARSVGQAIGVAVFGAIANSVIAQHGGNEADPATAVAAGSAVFAGAAVVAVILLLTSLAIPKRVVIADEAAAPEAAQSEA